MTTTESATVKNGDQTTIAVMAGDGGEQKLNIEDGELRRFIAEAQEIAKGASYNVNERRFASEETRFCIWEGQSPDGRKHSEAQDGRPAFPFEGASDARIRLADMIVNERVLILVAAALRNLPRVKGLELQNEGLGHKLTTLLNWVIKNKLGSQYYRVITELANYQEADSPSGAVLGVWWEQETALRMQTVTVEQLQQLLVQTLGQQAGLAPGQMADPAVLRPIVQRVAAMEAKLMDASQDDTTAAALQELAPHLSDRRAHQVVKDLREQGSASFPAPYLRLDQPMVCAYRLFEHVFFPTNTTEAQRSRCWFIREWLSEYELRERVVSDQYTEEFVEEVLKHEGHTGWPLYRRNPTQGDFMVIKQEESKEAYRGLYEVNTVLYKAVNDDYIPGIYYFPFHFAVEVAGHERRLLEYEHGQYPLVYFSREVLGKRLLDARGVPEIVATEQTAMKLLADSFNDNVSLSTLPNIMVPRRRSKLSLTIGPLKIIKEDRPGDVRWMEPPQYPQGNDSQQKEIRRRVDEYFGRVSAEIPPLLTQLHQTGMVMNFLASLGDALTQVLQLCQQYMSDEELAQVTGDDGIPIAHSLEEIQGKFLVEVSFDPRDLDLEYLKEIAGLIIQILQIDTLGTIERDKLVQRLFTMINPLLAANTLRPVQAANASEVKDEAVNFARIAAGDEPEMVKDGQNFPLRLQVLTGIVQKNPEAFQKLSPVSRKIFDARMEYLQNQVQQMRNAQIGRQVGKPALQEGEGISAGGPQGSE